MDDDAYGAIMTLNDTASSKVGPSDEDALVCFPDG